MRCRLLLLVKVSISVQTFKSLRNRRDVLFDIGSQKRLHLGTQEKSFPIGQKMIITPTADVYAVFLQVSAAAVPSEGLTFALTGHGLSAGPFFFCACGKVERTSRPRSNETFGKTMCFGHPVEPW